MREISRKEPVRDINLVVRDINLAVRDINLAIRDIKLAVRDIKLAVRDTPAAWSRAIFAEQKRNGRRLRVGA